MPPEQVQIELRGANSISLQQPGGEGGSDLPTSWRQVVGGGGLSNLHLCSHSPYDVTFKRENTVQLEILCQCASYVQFATHTLGAGAPVPTPLSLQVALSRPLCCAPAAARASARCSMCETSVESSTAKRSRSWWFLRQKKERPIWPASSSAAQAADWPRLAEARSSLDHD